ncbi:MAG TPA: ABC transporter permease [Candidatus Sulfotelmatobacter sp.]|nr:ABC transporter permease [Candidatus Sulfotelmatobacter sp.]
MRFSPTRALTIARREYLTTIRRKAFVFTLVFVPLYYALISALPAYLAGNSSRKRLAETHQIAVVDSSGALANAPREIRTEVTAGGSPFAAKKPNQQPEVFTAHVEFYPDQASGEAAVRAGRANQLLVMSPDYLQSGRMRRYIKQSSLFGEGQDRSLRNWLTSALIAGAVESTRAGRASRPMAGIQDFTLDRHDQWILKDDARDAVDIFLPIGVALLLAMSIVIGGQYLLQGVSEEKESRILESLLCTVTPDDLMVGKLLGLGTAGMTLVAAWTFAGLTFGGPVAGLVGARFTPSLMVFGVVYFGLGYLFYASLMTAIGAIANNLREAQQIAYMFTFANFIPMIVWFSVVDQPNGALARGFSLFPLTAATTMLMRLSTGAAIPVWELALSLALLAGSAALALRIGARVFRTGLLMYGKTPNLPEILRWVRQS